MSLRLFPHNQYAYDAAMHLLDVEGKAAIIHPTGTGKSFIAFQLVVEHPEANILWLAPSEYIFKTQLENLKRTNQLETAQIKNVKFLTYSKLMKNEHLNEQLPEEMHVDYIILDEFHRCGAAEWGKSIYKLLQLQSDAKILGLSATNVRYLDGQRDMAVELFDGVIASEMSLGQAIAKQILPTPIYVVSMYSYQEELKRLQKKIENTKNPAMQKENQTLLEKMRRALEQAEGLDQVFASHMSKDRGKYIVFCSGKEHMEEMASYAKEWFHLVDPEPHQYIVSYDNPEKDKAFAAFKEDQSSHLRLLYCIDMLNEGIHVDDIDGVILLRPTVSPIIYFQQIGRALSAGRKEKQPVIFDIVNNFESLYTIDTLQKDIENAFGLMAENCEEKQKFQEHFHIYDKLRDCREIFAQLNQNLNAGWEFYYLAALQFYQKNGHLRIPKSYVTDSGLTLGMWLQTQRRVKAGKVPGNLTEEKIQRLSELGMEWESGPKRNWKRGLEALMQYQKQYGDTEVKARYITEDGYALGKWVSNIRNKHKKGLLTQEQQEELENIGMIWDKKAYHWNQNYEAVIAYYKVHGNIDIPCNYVDENGNSLATWLHIQKSAYQNKANTTLLSEEQIKKLEKLDIQWMNKYEDRWQKWYTLAELYYKEHGDLKVRSTYCVNGEALGKWINSIRLTRKEPESSNRKLTEERIRQLDAIGMTWE